MASVALSENVGDAVYHALLPFGVEGANAIVVAGETLSSFTCAVCGASAFPTPSTDQYASVWSPWAAIEPGPE